MSAPTIVAFAGALTAFALFVIAEGRVQWPLVDLSLLRNSRFAILVIAGAIANIAYAVAIAGTVLEMLEGDGQSTATAIDVILGVLAVLLLAASAVVLWIARAPTATPVPSR